MHAVVDVHFENVGFPINGLEVGDHCGDAEIDQDGNVVSLSIEGLCYKTGRMRRVSFDVHRRDHPSADEIFLTKLAVAVQAQCASDIEDALSDWRESLSVREYDGAE